MEITFRLLGELKHVVGGDKHDVNVPARPNDEKVVLGDVLDEFLATVGNPGEFEKYIYRNPKKKELNPMVIILVNDTDYRVVGGMDAPVHDGDIVTIIPGLHGG